MRMKLLFAQLFRLPSAGKSVGRALALCLSALFLVGCGLQTGPEPTPTATRPMLATVPTFTPAPPSAPAAQASTGGETVQQPQPTPTPEQAAPPAEAPVPTDTPTPEPIAARFTVKTDLVAAAINVRSGPSTAFPPLGTISRGEQYDIIGKNAETTWYVFNFNGQQGWIYMGLVNVENEHLIARAQNIPNTPVPPPPAPTAAPAPVVQVPDDPCANIDCFFRLRNGPQFTHNGGTELKLTLGFARAIGGGKDEWQGSYFVGLSKDGTQVMPTVDQDWRVRSLIHTPTNGPHGQYNYDYSIGRDRLPGGTVAGNYTIWVMDGNANRASQNYSFSVPGDQGIVWIIFNQD